MTNPIKASERFCNTPFLRCAGPNASRRAIPDARAETRRARHRSISEMHGERRCAPKSPAPARCPRRFGPSRDRKSTRLNSSHDDISYAVFCLKKKHAATDIFSSVVKEGTYLSWHCWPGPVGKGAGNGVTATFFFLNDPPPPEISPLPLPDALPI